MSHKKKHNQRLHDLLKQDSNKKSLEEDAFEKDASEGFSLLDNMEEALELKKSLDARIYSEVMVKQKPRNRKTFWLAAAAFIGIVGFSIYFVPRFFEVQEKAVALGTLKKESALEQPFSKGMETKENEEADTLVDLSLSDKKNSNKNNSFGKRAAQEVSSNEDAAFLKEELPKENDVYKALPVEEPVFDSQVSSQTAVNAAPSSGNDAAIQKDAESEQIKATEVKTQASKKSSSESAARSSENLSKLDEISQVNKEKKSIVSCYYEGGELTLKKELADLLKPTNLVKPFDVVLSLNKNSKVEKVKFTNSFKLTKKEKDQVVQVLKSLSKFNVQGNLNKNEFVEYPLIFRP